jgi:hypothetical protein
MSRSLSDISSQVQYSASFNVAEQIFDALITWDKIGQLEVTGVSLKFFRQSLGVGGEYCDGSPDDESQFNFGL